MNEKPTTAKDAEMTVLKALGNYLAQDSCLTPKDKQKSTISSGELSGDKLGDFAEGQWWLTELDAAVANGTNDQKRAVAVVRNLLRTAQAAVEQERDVMLEALQGIAAGNTDPDVMVDIARAAIAKVEGGGLK